MTTPRTMSAPSPIIFVVDDDRSMCQATQRLLNAAGFQARTFESAEALLDSGAVDDAACFVLDVNLPGLSGFELAARLGANGTRHIPVIFITAYDQPGSAAKAQELHALAYLRKPFAAAELLTAVRRGIQPQNSSAQT
jgi:FixJ family two-component response regulator